MRDGWLVVRFGLIMFVWCIFSITWSAWATFSSPNSPEAVMDYFRGLRGKSVLNAHF